MNKITPHLWFDKEAKEAAEFYVSLFSNSKINNITTLHNTPSGDCDVVSFELAGLPFMAISAGPIFKFNPSISFMVACDTKEELDALWEQLSKNGKTLMPLDKYPFSERYGWTEDRFGLSWQLILSKPEGEVRPKIVPSLLFVGDIYGKAEEAVNFYLSVIKPSKLGTMIHYGPGQEPNREGTVMFSDFMLLETWFSAMDGGGEHKFKFNEAVSFIISCKDQEEIDYYWDKLSAVPEAEQCGWLKDKFGLSWQIAPAELDDMMNKGTPEQIDRITQAFLPMKKFDVARLKEAFEGK